ncbi:jg18176, partial [Pararge aegeria aegeria]
MDIPNKVLSNSAFVHNQYKQQLKSDLQDKTNQNIENLNKDARTTKVNFFKRGPLQTNFLDTGVINAEPNIKVSNTARHDTDDIEITIKIGKTVSNICIQKKEKDVKVSIKSDQEIQTSLSTCMGNEHNLHSSLIEPNAQTGSHNNIAMNNDISVCTSQQGISKVQKQKSLSTKKNTTSADTSSAHFEITESEEKEFEDQMENVPHANKQDKNDSQKLIKSDCTLKSNNQLSLKNLEAITEDVEFLNDVDIFEGESVKEGNIQTLESTANTPSAIIMPTVKSKSTSQKKTNKRDREICDTENLSKNKKIKITQGSISNSKSSRKAVVNSNILDGESENINYDSIMSQVFANINADMQNLQKTDPSIQMQTQISNTQKSNNKKIQLPNM